MKSLVYIIPKYLENILYPLFLSHATVPLNVAIHLKIPVMTEGTADTPLLMPMDSSFRMSGVGDGSNGDGDGRMGGCSLVNVVSPI